MSDTPTLAHPHTRTEERLTRLEREARLWRVAALTLAVVGVALLAPRVGAQDKGTVVKAPFIVQNAAAQTILEVKEGKQPDNASLILTARGEGVAQVVVVNGSRLGGFSAGPKATHLSVSGLHPGAGLISDNDGGSLLLYDGKGMLKKSLPD